MSRVLVRLVAWVVARFAFERLGAAGAVLGFLAGDLLRIRRAHVEAAMMRAGVDDAAAEARAMYRALGQGALELLWLSSALPERRERVLTEHVVVPDDVVRALDEALAAGPVVIGASHTGSWELAVLAASRIVRKRGKRFVVVAKPISSPSWHDFMARVRRSTGAEIVDPRGALSAVRRALREGGVVVMPIDQVPDAERHGVVADFLGAPAWLDRAPATMAARHGATLLVTAARREGARCHLELLASLAPARGVEAIVRVTRAASAALEAYVRRRPSTWLWLHRRWKRAGAPRAAHLIASAR